MSMDTSFEPLDTRGAVLGDEVFRVLGKAILEGRLRPGDRLRDVELAQMLGVSRTPIREALQRLERMGLVEVSANRWTRVTAPSATAYDETREFMALIVGDALHLALSRCDDETHGTLIGLAEALEVAARSGDAMATLGAQVVFYQQVIRASRNGIFAAVMREAGLTLQRNLQQKTPDSATPALADRFAELRDAVKIRDAVAAEQVLLGMYVRADVPDPAS